MGRLAVAPHPQHRRSNADTAVNPTIGHEGHAGHVKVMQIMRAEQENSRQTGLNRHNLFGIRSFVQQLSRRRTTTDNSEGEIHPSDDTDRADDETTIPRRSMRVAPGRRLETMMSRVVGAVTRVESRRREVSRELKDIGRTATGGDQDGAGSMEWRRWTGYPQGQQKAAAKKNINKRI